MFHVEHRRLGQDWEPLLYGSKYRKFPTIVEGMQEAYWVIRREVKSAEDVVRHFKFTCIDDTECLYLEDSDTLAHSHGHKVYELLGSNVYDVFHRRNIQFRFVETSAPSPWKIGLNVSSGWTGVVVRRTKNKSSPWVVKWDKNGLESKENSRSVRIIENDKTKNNKTKNDN